MKKMLVVWFGMLLMIGALPVPLFAADAPVDYLAAWDFESQTADGKISDLGSGGFHGVIRKSNGMSVAAAQGINGSAALKNSYVTDSQMNAPGLGAALAPKSVVTMSLWVNAASIGNNSSKQEILFNIPNTAGNVGVSASIQTDGKLKLECRKTDGSTTSTTTDTAVVTSNHWYHTLFTVDLSNNTETNQRAKLSIYVDGAKCKEVNNTVGSMATFDGILGYSDSALDFRLGGNGSYTMNGYLDDVRVFDRALTAEEITALAALGQQPEDPDEPKLAASWDFENAEASAIPDTAGNGWTGTINTNADAMSLSAGEGLNLTTALKSAPISAGSSQMNAPGLGNYLKKQTAITISLWGKLAALPDPEQKDYNLFNIPNTAGFIGLAGYIARGATSNSTGAQGEVCFQLRNMGGSIDTLQTGVTIKAGRYYMLTFIADMTAGGAATKLTVYIDGEKAGEKTVNNGDITAFDMLGASAATDFRLGGNGTSVLDGCLDNVNVYNYPLTVAEIQTLMADTLSKPEFTSLTVGGTECKSLPYLQVADAETAFGANLDVSAPVTGIAYTLSENATVQVWVNDTLTNDEALPTCTLHIGDVVVLRVTDTNGRADSYKLNIGKPTVQRGKTTAADQYGTAAEYLTAGDMAFRMRVRANSGEPTLRMYAALYDTADDILERVHMSKTTLTEGQEKELTVSLPIPEDYNGKQVKIYLWDEQFIPVGTPERFVQEEVSVEGLQLPSVFASNSVLQRGAPIKVWGRATPGKQVTVSFGGSSDTAAADYKGNFTATLPAIAEANAEGQTMTVTDGETTLTFDNILVGDVWLCGGQSNMRWSLNTVDDADALIADAANYPNIRLYNQNDSYAAAPQFDTAGGNWAVCTSDSAKAFSGVGYLFGKGLHLDKNVPVGLISAAYGGSRLEAWMSYRAIHSDPRFEALDGRLSATDKRRPTYLYNAMLKPIEGYAIKGMIFYQGEANTYDAALYRDLFPAFCRDFRENWGMGNLPIVYAQISAYDSPYASENWVGLRQAQADALTDIPNAAIVVTMDIGEQDNIHPKNKQPVADRMLLAAKALAYGDETIYRSPAVSEAQFSGNSVTLTFTDTGDGLDTAQTLSNFTLLDAAGTEYPAEAAVTGTNTITVSSDGLSDAVGVRYACSKFPAGGMTVWSTQNGQRHLPAGPFEITAQTE